jgi:hypothetical protein
MRRNGALQAFMRLKLPAGLGRDEPFRRDGRTLVLSKMSLRSTALSALLLLAGCATGASNKPVAKRRAVHAAPPAAAKQPTQDEQTDEPPPIATRNPTVPAADPPASSAPVARVPSSAPKAEPFGDVGLNEVNEKDWLAGVRRNIAQREGIAAADLRFSPGFLRATFVRSSLIAVPAKSGRRVSPRRHEIVVVDNQGRRVASFPAIAARGSDEPPRDLQFLSEERLVYEVIAPAPAAALPPRKQPTAPRERSRGGAHAIKAKPMVAAGRGPSAALAAPAIPLRLFVIQPLASRARPIRCEGLHFTFTREHDRLAFIGGSSGAAFVAVDGAQVYPRHGRTTVAAPPVWSKDGLSLAFVEAPPARSARLVLVAEVDNPAGDITWDLPKDANIEGAAVVWSGAGKLLVRKTATRPIFSASVVTDR